MKCTWCWNEHKLGWPDSPYVQEIALKVGIWNYEVI